MALYAVGGEADTFYPVSGQTYGHTTTAGRFVSNASRGALIVTQGTSEMLLDFNANVTEAWIHMYLYQETVAGNVDGWIQIKKLDGSDAFRINLNSDGTWDVQAYQGSTWVNLFTTASSQISNSAAAFDLYLKVNGSTGEATLYKDGVSQGTFSGDTSLDNASFGRLHFYGQTGGSNELNISQIIVASESTIGWVLMTLSPDGNGANTAWTGTFADIDEFTLNTADYIEAIATNLVETSTATNINAAYSTYNVKGVAVGIRASNDSGSVISDLQAAVRVGSTNYFSPNLGLTKDGTDYSKYYIWENNPATSAAWAQAAVNALEIGVKSV
jgi:hypothetical protein